MPKRNLGGDSPAIEARGLVKTYGKNQALDGIDLTIRRGQVFGFLGPNGAGKTTTIRILATLTWPDGGTARVLGHDVLTEPNLIRCRPEPANSHSARTRGRYRPDPAPPWCIR